MPKLRIRSAVETFLASCDAASAHSHHTLRAYRCDLKQFAAHLPPKKTLQKIELSDIESWLAALSHQAYAPASRRRKLATLRLLLNHFVRRGLLESSPLQNNPIRVPVPDHLPRALEISDARAILKRVRANANSERAHPLRLRDRAILEILLSTGIRVGELAALSSSDYLTDHQSLLIKGKGNRERLALLADQSTREALQNLIAARGTPSRLDAPLFINQRGTRLGEQGVAYILRRIARAAGVQRAVTPHMLRHTAATLLLLNGADMRIVQDFLGHSSIATTQLYTRLTPALLREELNKHHHGHLLAE